MAFNTPVNGQVTDAITQANVSVLGTAPAMATGTLYQTAAHALGLLLQNETAQQQRARTVADAAASALVARFERGL